MVLLSGALFLLSSLCRGLWRRRRPAVALR
jgi:hypothetical protein